MKHFRLTSEKQCLLYWFFVAVLVLPNIFQFFTEGLPMVGALCNLFLPLGIFMLLMTLCRRPGNMLWLLFLFVFFNAFQLVLLSLFGEGPIAVDMFLNLVTTNTDEAGELLGGIIIPTIAVIILYGVTLLLAYKSSKSDSIMPSNFVKKMRNISVGVTAVGVILLPPCYLNIENYKAENDIYPANALYNLVMAIQRNIKTENYFKTSTDFTFQTVSSRPDSLSETYVFIIGETSRSANWQLYGYQRPTNPRLDSIKSSLVVFKDAMTQSNTTHKSVAMLLSAVSAENFDSIYTQKGILDAFNECGYDTYFFSNQRYNHSFIDFFADGAKSTYYAKEAPGVTDAEHISDDVLLPLLQNALLSNTTKKFIVLHTYGSHYKYNERYTRDFAYFQPDDFLSSGKGERDKLINAYDNSLRYTDDFIYRVIRIVEKQNNVSAVVYLSDHGEDIYDDSRNLFLHASPLPSSYQLRVPFIVWLSPEYKSQFQQKSEALNANVDKPVATSLVAYHTLMSLAGISGPYIDLCNSVADSTFVATPRHYLNDHNKPVDAESFK